MIVGIFHEGSGLGDQLFRYVTVRTLANDRGSDLAWAMMGKFKGDFFLKQPRIEKGYTWSVWNEKSVRDEHGVDIRSYDPEINFVDFNSIIDGSFEDDKYWRHNLENINKWLAVEPLEVSDDLCVIGFRGGEYATQPDLFLDKSYYNVAIDAMFTINKNMKFEIHTDDPERAQLMFESCHLPDFKVIENTPISHSRHSNMGFNWRSARYAKYAIIPNSAFFIFPRILKHLEDPTAVTIAPRYWARHNKKIWARPACYYKEFTYV